MQDVIIIGCGVIGAACAYELSKYKLNVAVLEKSSDIANGATKANSGIVHAGYDPLPGTAMARLNVSGNTMMESLCERLDVPFRRVGSHVLAFDENDLQTIRILYARGIKNGVPGLRLLNAAEVRRMEPSVAETVQGSLYAPSAGIVSPWELCLALAETAVRNGVQMERDMEVRSIRKENGVYCVSTSKDTFSCRYLINAAGVYSDRIHNMITQPRFTITPSRGEYYLLDKSEGRRVNSVLFQCPNKLGKGVLVSPTVHGNLIVGPNAERVDVPDDVSTTASGLNYVCETALKSVPKLNLRENIRNFAGMRANHGGDDFLIGECEDAEGFYDLAGIKSPGLTSAPAIAVETVEWLRGKTRLDEKENWDGTRRIIRFAALSEAERNALIEKDSRYGRVICRCETVTEGEIVDAIHSPIPATTVNAVKRRVSAGMGRCQGGFCGPRVLEILARELKRPVDQVMMEEEGSWMVTRDDERSNVQ